ncbi:MULTISPECIES: peptidase U32 family protein [Priestia]|jgi:putative protease|uniref:Peptidase, U32 family n=4 Tax=Priestia TaxID=2800373 RepID=D5DSZ7_PRIM1|nr:MULTISPECIES: peptidase U32 family protein [Priestia]AVX10484.1 collagenase-like protease [Bacillus sp. Y-01]KOP76561.1 peptidase U32 [Bacillus sp. FJAT-21351]KQU14500.1 peptidase U32 [Bacillus sp. Leaf75]KRF57864.1 peptidase U32 [Bacillus sp. Soil531]MBZ5477897.1 U32 family peptidase [Bacillus sp. T_4]MCF6798477.1 U32 family peptidase [Bacillus sp. ET1]MCJ7984503.1 U32 family peptidase [Priestia sp. OVL9]MDH6652381.1 putative protease [Bacillus sp. PvP124]MDP9577530.1 putative protease
MKKPELLVTPTAVSEIESLLQAGATAVMVGEQRYGLRLAGEFKREDIVEAVNIAHQHNAKVYVAMNGLFHNDKIAELNEYILFLKEASVDAIVFGDPAVLMAVRETAPEMKMHWSTETTGTNWYSCNYWGRKGAKRAVLARELSMDSIIDIKEKAEVEIEVQVHGMTCMFQSKRSLLGNYFEYQGKVMEIENRKVEKDMFLLDNERNNKYPIFEDENGTHIMSPNDMCIIDELSEMIDAEVDVFKIDGVLKSPQYILEVTKKYRQAIDLCVDDREEYENVKDDLLEEIESLQPINRPLDTGFFFKETVY